MRRRAVILGALSGLFVGGCLGAVPNLRSYFVLAGDPVDAAKDPIIKGMLRVRNMDSDSVYEKFQIVVRRSPFELRYSELNVWAVKPNQLVSDIIAKTMLDSGTFSGVTRGLGDVRPDYTMSGEIHAIEIYDSDDVWYAHLALSLWLNRFDSGDRIWSFSYDQRKLVPSRTFEHAVRALSELLSAATRQVITELIDQRALHGSPGGTPPPAPADREPAEGEGAPKPAAPEEDQLPEPIYVPEKPAERPQ